MTSSEPVANNSPMKLIADLSWESARICIQGLENLDKIIKASKKPIVVLYHKEVIGLDKDELEAFANSFDRSFIDVYWSDDDIKFREFGFSALFFVWFDHDGRPQRITKHGSDLTYFQFECIARVTKLLDCDQEQYNAIFKPTSGLSLADPRKVMLATLDLCSVILTVKNEKVMQAICNSFRKPIMFIREGSKYGPYMHQVCILRKSIEVAFFAIPELETKDCILAYEDDDLKYRHLKVLEHDSEKSVTQFFTECCLEVARLRASKHQ